MFFDHKPKLVPAEDLANLKVQDARVRDTLSVQGAADDFSDIDFTVDRRDSYEAGSNQWFEVSGPWRDRRAYLEIHAPDVNSAGVVEVFGNFDGRRLTLDAFGLTENDMGEIDQRQNPSDFIDFEGRFWLFRFSREIGIFSEGTGGESRDTGRGFYCWQFQEQDGKRHLSVRKFEGDPFSASIWTTIEPADVTLFRGA